MSMLLVPAGCRRLDGPVGETEPLIVKQARLDVSIDHWDGVATRADGTASWPDGAMIYFRLDGIGGSLPLEFRYRASDDAWQLLQYYRSDDSYGSRSNPDLSGFTGGHCVCYYFEQDNGQSARGVSLADGGGLCVRVGVDYAAYRDDEAIYGIVDGVLSVKARLRPITGRIRMECNPNDSYDYYYPGIYGLRYFTELNLDTFELSSSDSYVSGHLNTDNSRYYYGSFADPERRVLTVEDRKWSHPTCYERSFTEDILAPGCSNRSYMPIDVSHNEWYRFAGSIGGWNFGVDGMQMLYVVPGSFRMGGEDAQPVHTVTLTKGFYLSETEVTKDMWYKVMGEPSDYANAAVPVTGKSWDEVMIFIATLNTKSGYHFRLPTEAEWEFAARGGMKSGGYKYSGSDTYSEVAVRDGNWSMQAVKTKNPNELGFYDMSGNAAEWVSDWYAAYPTGSVVDPTGPETGEIHLRRGGNRGQKTEYLTVTFRDFVSDESLTGFRLAMDVPIIH